MAFAAMAAGQEQYLSPLPTEFQNAPASWAYVSYANPSVAAIKGTFNRTIAQAPWASETDNVALQEAQVETRPNLPTFHRMNRNPAAN